MQQKMAPTLLESSSELNQLFRDISSKFSPSESEDVVKSSKRIYGEQFKSLGNQDLLSCLGRFHEFDYVSNKKLTLIKEFVATKSKNENEIKDRIKNFKDTHPVKPEKEKKFKGRIDEIKKITEKLKMKEKPVVNLHGSAGVGKTTLAKEIYKKWAGQSNIFDLRGAKEMKAVYLNIMGTLGINIPVGLLDIDRVVGRIHDHIKEKGKGEPFLFLLDNVEQFTEGKGKEGKNLRTQFIQFLSKLSEFEGKAGTLNLLLTSRTQLKYSKVTDYELKPLEDSFSEKILLPGKTSNVDVQQKNELLGICKGVPLLLKGTAAILKQRRKSLTDLIDEIEITSKRETKYEQDTEERPFDSEEEGIDERQTSIIREMFYTLPSDSLRISAVSVSLFHGPFSAVTAAKILGLSNSEAVAQLEGLVTNEIIHVVDEDAKQLMYDIHPLLRRYAESIKNDVMFYESYIEAKGRFYEHFMSRMREIATFVESDYVRAFNEIARDRANFEFTIDFSLLPEYFSVPGGYHENALLASFFNVMLSGKKQTELFHSLAEMCKDDGSLGSLFRAQLRCWEAKQVLEAHGTREALETLEKGSLSLEQVHDQSTESFRLTKGLILYFEGEIYHQKRDYRKAIECLNSCLDLMESPLKLDTNLARCYNALGNCYYRLNRPDTALKFYNKALKMQEELSGSDFHFDMPVYKNQIGTVHEIKGEYHEAVKCYKDALELLKDVKLTGYEDEALFRRNLANVYVHLKKFTEADEEAEKAYNIRQKVLGNHPDTVRSIFQRGVIQANLRAFKKALDFFLQAWEMEKILGAGNQSAVWRLIIKGVFDMCDFLKNKNSEKEKFRKDALDFCQRFWKDEKASPQFGFTAYNKEIIDCILYLLREKPITYRMTDKKERALIDEYEREAIWFYDGMEQLTDEDFNSEFDNSKDNNVLNEMLRDRTELLDKLIELCGRHDKHDELLKHKRGKLMLFKKVLVRLDFVGEKEQKKSTLKKAVEDLYKDVREKRSIKEFRESLLATWQQQWEEGKDAEETKEKLVAKERMIKGILQLCEELKMKDLRKRYGKEALSFGERLWEMLHSEMEPSVKKKLLGELKDLASSIGDHESVKVYRDALQGLLEGTVEQLYKDAEEASIEWEGVKGAEETKSESEIINELNDALRTSDTHRQKAPSEILARGPMATEAYRTALLEGKGYSRRVPVMIIGQDRTGKTSLKRSLKGQLFNRDERSTKGIETDPTYFKVSTDVWRTSKINEDTEPEPTFSFEYQTAQSIVETIKKEIPDDFSRNPSGSGTESSKPHQSRSNKHQAAQLTPDSFKGNTDNSSTEELSINPSNSETEASKVIKKTKEPSDEPSSIMTERSPKDSELVENARADLEPAEEPSTEGMDTSLQDSQDHLRGPNLPDDIAALVQRLLENNKEVENEDAIYSIVWDFGGQSVYYVTHPIFLTERAIYILTCDLSRDPNQTDNAPMKSSMRGNVEDTWCSKTPLDYLDFWMSSVYSLVNPEFAGSPPVFLVCTHADEPYKSVDPVSLASEVYDVLKKKPYRKLLKGFFVVDNTKSGSKSECQGVIKLRTRVDSVTKKLPQMNELIPLKWLKFEKVLRLLSEEGHNWIPIEEARKISSHECGINDDKQFSTLLDFLHDQRVLIHFNETPELENMVILSPQWLIDVFKEVITVKSWEQVDENVVEENVVELWRDLEDKGILDEKLLDHLWTPLFDDRENCESLIAIMERFSLLCSLPSDGTTKKYLVPSMLKSPPTDKFHKLLDSVRIPSLFVRFGSGRVPAGLFSRLILMLHQWYLDKLKRPISPNLFDNFAFFHIHPLQATSVILLCHSSSIEIVFHAGDVASARETDINNESNLNASRDIHRQLRLFLECMREKFFWLKHMRYEMCVSCPVCSLQEGSSKCCAHKVRGCDCLHLLTEQELQMSPCCEKGIVCADIRIRKEIFLPWFAFLDERESRIPLIQQEHLTARNQSEKHCAVTTGDTQKVAEVESSLSSKQPSSKGIKQNQTIDGSSVTDQGAVKEGSPTRYELEGLSRKVSDKWQTLGRRLGFDDEKLLDFDQKKKLSDKAYDMLIAWKQANGSDATYLVLNKALRHEYVELRDLAEKFCCH